MGHIFEGLHALLKLEMAKILLDYIGHGHTQPGREISRRHCAQLRGIL